MSPPAPARRDHLYADPRVYDVLHRPGTVAEVRGLIRMAERALGGSGPWRWLEPASGTGRYLIELARRGHTGTGIDLAAEMTDYARAAAAGAGVGTKLDLVTARMEAFRLSGPFDAAFCPINSIRHLGSDRAMLAHLGCVRRALRAGGVYIVGLEVADPRCAAPTEDVWIGRERGLHVHQFVSYIPAAPRSRREVVHSHLTVTRREPGGSKRERASRSTAATVEHRDSRYALRTYTLAQWLGLIARAGWKVQHVCEADGLEIEPKPIGYQLWVLGA